uniref:Uncharacterized protein n=1 Tax=Oryza meridionalis TaxID=40149 RepID=A0A0E0DV41_9ORYZ
MHAIMARRCSGDYSTAGQRAGEEGGGGGLRLFGVQLHAAAASSPASYLHKSYSMDCLRLQVSSPSSLPSSSSSPSPLTSSLLLSIDEGCERPAADGYLSDGPHGAAATMRERKKGVPWSEQEHRLFLAGLEKLGKGDWRGISRSFVTTRTPTQVASHAQKFFLRHNSAAKKTNNKRRSSLFDMVQDCDSGGRSLASSDPATRCNNNISASLSLQVSHHKSAGSAWPSSETPSVSEAQQGHGYGTSHHCSPLDLELGMSLSTTPSIGT